MAAKYLGDYFDIHCGGEDHISIHHTNEIAQTEAARGTRLANFWMHGYFLQLDNAKMAKSSGDFLRLSTLIEKGIEPIVYRYFCLTAHYRTQMSFSWESLDASSKALSRLYKTAFEWGEPGEVIEAVKEAVTIEVNDDLNFPKALAHIWDMVRSDAEPADKKATLLELDALLGLNFATWQPSSVAIPSEILELVNAREAARASKDFPEADRLREEVRSKGFLIEDSREGPKISPV